MRLTRDRSGRLEAAFRQFAGRAHAPAGAADTLSCHRGQPARELSVRVKNVHAPDIEKSSTPTTIVPGHASSRNH